MKLALGFSLLITAVAPIVSLQAATIAVIDSGLDYKHEMIIPNLWVNPLEIADRRDNDANGYQDDIHGWNFGEYNSEIIDYKYLGTFSPDCTKYFDIQGKMLLKVATEAEIAWLKERIQDKKFLAEMGKFGNFIHGTHVSGITIRNSSNRVMGIKLIPTEVKPFFDRAVRMKTDKRWAILEMTFDALAKQQMKLLTEIALFIHGHKAEIANGSFGTGFAQSKMITDAAFKLLFFRAPDDEESNRAANLFIGALINHGQSFVAAAPNTLFVFAAGNDGTSNDEFGISPGNIRADNVITVAATYKDEYLAAFSNFGVKHVDIAAPGMLINSAIPGNEYLQVSGTSQAAPYVAGVAAQVKEANPDLSPAQIKEILMGTVDKKLFLTDKVKAGGIVNRMRARQAGELSRSEPVATAILRANRSMKSMDIGLKSDIAMDSIIPLPLAPMFR